MTMKSGDNRPIALFTAQDENKPDKAVRKAIDKIVKLQSEFIKQLSDHHEKYVRKNGTPLDHINARSKSGILLGAMHKQAETIVSTLAKNEKLGDEEQENLAYSHLVLRDFTKPIAKEIRKHPETHVLSHGVVNLFNNESVSNLKLQSAAHDLCEALEALEALALHEHAALKNENKPEQPREISTSDELNGHQQTIASIPRMIAAVRTTSPETQESHAPHTPTSSKTDIKTHGDVLGLLMKHKNMSKDMLANAIYDIEYSQDKRTQKDARLNQLTTAIDDILKGKRKITHQYKKTYSKALGLSSVEKTAFYDALNAIVDIDSKNTKENEKNTARATLNEAIEVIQSSGSLQQDAGNAPSAGITEPIIGTNVQYMANRI